MNSIENALRIKNENKMKLDRKSITSNSSIKSRAYKLDDFKENQQNENLAAQRYQKHREVESYLNKKYNTNRHPEYSDLKEMASKLEKSIPFLHEWFEIKRAMSLKNRSTKI